LRRIDNLACGAFFFTKQSGPHNLQKKSSSNKKFVSSDSNLTWWTFIARNSNLKPWLESLFAQIHIDLRLTGFRLESNRGPADNPNFSSPALFSTELQ